MSDTEENETILYDVDNTTAPLLLSDKVKCDLTKFTFYILRLTPENNNYSMADVTEFVEDLASKKVWFVSEEQSKKAVKHYHCVFTHPNGLDPREEIKSWLVRLFPGVWKKQDGNKRYNLQVVEDIEKSFMYTSKDGDYLFGSGINPDYITYVNSKSFQKKDTRIGQLMVARQVYLKGGYDDIQLFQIVCDVCIATSSTGSLNMTYVKSFMTGAKAEREPSYRVKLFNALCL